MEVTPEDKKRLRGFMFLSVKLILYVLNIWRVNQNGGKNSEEAVGKYKLSEVVMRP